MWLWLNYRIVIDCTFMKRISKVMVLLAAAPLMAFGVTPDKPASTNSPASLDSLFTDSVIAKGKGVEIKRNELESEVENTRAVFAAQRMAAPPDLDQEALRSLVIKQLVLNKATAPDRAKAKDNFENYLTTIRTNNGWTEDELNQRINTQLFGKTRAQWDQDNIDQRTIPVVIQRELNIKVTDEDARKFYEDPANIHLFEQPEMVRASHILLMTEDAATKEPLSADKKAAKHKQMEDILKQARAGTNFAELAKKYSEDPGSKDKGGEYTFPRGQMMKEFEDTAFSLKPGEISDIIETQYGYHIIKLSEKIPAKKVDFVKVKDRIKDHLAQVEMGKQFRQYAMKLEKDANVEIVDDKYKGVDLAPAPPKTETEAPAPTTGAK